MKTLERTPIVMVPTWDDEAHELRLGEMVVKRFRQRAKNQEMKGGSREKAAEKGSGVIFFA